MTRLADRMLLGCQSLRPSLVFGRDGLDSYLRWEMSKQSPKPLDEKEFERGLPIERAQLLSSEPLSSRQFDVTTLDGVPVFVADEVAIYALSLPEGTYIGDVVSSMAPPFDKFFVEFQGVGNVWKYKVIESPEDQHLSNVHAWGCLINVIEDPRELEHAANHFLHSSSCIEGIEGRPRWILDISTFLEWEKSKPFGPVGWHRVGLAEDGTWLRHGDGHLWWEGGMPDPVVPPEVNQAWTNFIALQVFPALLTISFLHCKNVEIRAVIPPEKLSKRHHKKHGRDLVRYHILDIKPLRRLLDRHRAGLKEDLRRALHICRGHFKTFTPDAPLWGRHIGTYWWAPHVRGSKSAGVVLKDYRVSAPSEFGRIYRDADENPAESAKEAPPSKDPDGTGRGLAAHNRTQNQIAEIVRGLGWFPRSPAPGEPDFDVAWKVKDTFFVCEVKSLSPTNEERQLRMAVGQVIRYRQKLNAAAFEPVMAVIATEMAPQDQSWNQLCEHENIVLVWPQVAKDKIIEAAETMEIDKIP